MHYFQESNLDNNKTYSAKNRASKVRSAFQARPFAEGASFRTFLDSLPHVFRADDLRNLALAVIEAKEKQKPVIAMIGGHVIKTGCTPVLIDLARNGFITHFASNGSVAIHDTEMAWFGHTSEEVCSQLETGMFGMAHDTAEFVNKAAKCAADNKTGFGTALGFLQKEAEFPYIDRGLIASCYGLGIPFTLHVALGTDIVHQHASADGAAIGQASLRDFRILISSVADLGGGGVVVNLGSAVIMPEVFLKCLAVARNQRDDVRDFTTANFDMIQHYRPHANVLHRPVSLGGQAFAITGHHEIMIPMLAAAIKEYAVSK
ncbi:MAG: hypothetical protein K9K82_01385 [Desulfobacteraceae bacterium]|nr:hypothetical protein [Desulfobacteraceae bacterium]